MSEFHERRDKTVAALMKDLREDQQTLAEAPGFYGVPMTITEEDLEARLQQAYRLGWAHSHDRDVQAVREAGL